MRIRVETSSGMPITRQIAAQIRAQCASRALKPGDRLPSVRALAAELAVNQNTILRVYERLTAEGLLERRHGDGTFVADRVPDRPDAGPAAIAPAADRPRGRTGQDAGRRARGNTSIVGGNAETKDQNHERHGHRIARHRQILRQEARADRARPRRCRKARSSGLLGTNGSGKTTLIKCALGLIRPQHGEARLLGEDSWTLSAEAKMRIGYVPQVINLYPWMKVRHLIDYTAAFYPNWNHDLVARLMTRMVACRANDRIGPLSVGQLQKVAIVLALGHEPDLLILDEPAASLDPLARRQFLQMIIDLAEPGKRTVLFSTHITSDLERVADRVAILKSGRIAWHGLLEDLKEQTHVSLEDSFLGDAQCLTATPTSKSR